MLQFGSVVEFYVLKCGDGNVLLKTVVTGKIRHAGIIATVVALQLLNEEIQSGELLCLLDVNPEKKNTWSQISSGIEKFEHE